MTPTLEPQVRPVNPEPTDDDKLWATLAHVGSGFVSVLVPIVVLLVKGKQSHYVKVAAIEALNFQITVLIVAAIGLALTLIAVGMCILLPLSVAAPILAIVAGVKAWQGEQFRYPLTLRLIKE